MRVSRPELWLHVLVMTGTLLLGGTLAHAQSDWFRPPGNVGTPSSRPSPPQQAPTRRQQQQQQPPQQYYRQQQARPQPVPQQQVQPRQSWSPFQPFINMFRSEPRRYVQPGRPRDVAPPVARSIETPAEPRGTVHDSIAAARKSSDKVTDVVLVLGDQYAGPLAQGLADAFVADREGVVVIGKGEEGSGLSPDSKYDWVGAGGRLASSEEASVVVVFAGSNDFSPITDPTGRAEVLDEHWREIYGRRIDAFLQGLKLHGRPVVVVGLPPVDDTAASERNVQFNAMLKERVERAGLLFVDVWDGFADENGKFMMSGPAVDGQRRRLRTADGVGFTRAGGRKLAFFVDRQLDELLKRETDPAAAAAAVVNPADTKPSIILLTGGAASGARSLAGAPTAPVVPAKAVIGAGTPAVPAHRLVSGDALPAVVGRTDDFSWPASQPATPDPLIPPAPASPLPGAGMGTSP